MSPSLGTLIRQLREHADLSQEELAARADVSRATIQSVENGRHAPRRASLKRIAAALGVDVETLKSGDQPSAAADEVEVVSRELRDLERDRRALSSSDLAASTFKVIAQALDAEITQRRAQLGALRDAAGSSDTLSESGS